MSTSAVILIVVAVIAIAAIGWLLYSQRRRQALRARFGPEYSHAVSQYGNDSKAQAALAARERRMEKIHVRPLSREDHQRFGDQWIAVQRDFVDNPAG